MNRNISNHEIDRSRAIMARMNNIPLNESLSVHEIVRGEGPFAIEYTKSGRNGGQPYKYLFKTESDQAAFAEELRLDESVSIESVYNVYEGKEEPEDGDDDLEESYDGDQIDEAGKRVIFDFSKAGAPKRKKIQKGTGGQRAKWRQQKRKRRAKDRVLAKRRARKPQNKRRMARRQAFNKRRRNESFEYKGSILESIDAQIVQGDADVDVVKPTSPYVTTMDRASIVGLNLAMLVGNEAAYDMLMRFVEQCEAHIESYNEGDMSDDEMKAKAHEAASIVGELYTMYECACEGEDEEINESVVDPMFALRQAAKQAGLPNLSKFKSLKDPNKGGDLAFTYTKRQGKNSITYSLYYDEKIKSYSVSVRSSDGSETRSVFNKKGLKKADLVGALKKAADVQLNESRYKPDADAMFELNRGVEAAGLGKLSRFKRLPTTKDGDVRYRLVKKQGKNELSYLFSYDAGTDSYGVTVSMSDDRETKVKLNKMGVKAGDLLGVLKKAAAIKMG